MQVEKDTLYTLPQLGEGLGISVRTLQRLISKGDLPARRLGKSVFVLGADLLESMPRWASETSQSKHTRSKGKVAPGAGTHDFRLIGS